MLCRLRSAATSCQTLEQEPRHSPGARAQLPPRTPCHSLQTVSPRRPTSWGGQPVSLSVPQAEGLPGVLPGAASLVTVSGAKKGRKTQLFLLGCPGHGTVKSKPPRAPYRRGPITAQPAAPRGAAHCPQAGRTPAPWDGDMRTDDQPKGQPGPGEGPTRDVPDRPRNTKDLRAEAPPKGTERLIPTAPNPQDTRAEGARDQSPARGRGPSGRAARSGQPPPTARAHPRQAREGPCGPATGRFGAVTATPEGATRLPHRLSSSTRSGSTATRARDTFCCSTSLLILRTLPSPRDMSPQRVHPRQQPEPAWCCGWHTVGPAPSTCGAGRMPSTPRWGPGGMSQLHVRPQLERE